MSLKKLDGDEDQVQKDKFFCDICRIGFTSETTFSNHEKGKVHEMKVKALKADEKPGDSAKPTRDRSPLTRNEQGPFAARAPHNNERKAHIEKAPVIYLNGIPTASSSSNGSQLRDGKPTYVNSKPANSSSNFYCEICDVNMTGDSTYQQHLQGAKHAKAVTRKGLSVNGDEHARISTKPKTIAAEARGQAVLDAYTKGPLIGLRYITEFVSSTGDLSYVCQMCETRTDPPTLISHLISAKHRINFMRENFMNYYVQVEQSKRVVGGGGKVERKDLIDELAWRIENEIGRDQIQVKHLESDSAAAASQGDKLKRLQQQMQLAEQLKRTSQHEKKHIPPDAHVFSVQDAMHRRTEGMTSLHRIQSYTDYEDNAYGENQFTRGHFRHSASSRGSEHQDNATNDSGFSVILQAVGADGLSEFVEYLSTSLITNEEEAALALHVSNTLTQSLLRYRLNQTAGR